MIFQLASGAKIELKGRVQLGVLWALMEEGMVNVKPISQMLGRGERDVRQAVANLHAKKYVKRLTEQKPHFWGLTDAGIELALDVRRDDWEGKQ